MIEQFTCEFCNKLFERDSAYIKFRKQNRVFCSIECTNKSRQRRIIVNCTYCNRVCEKTISEFQKSKSKLFYCSRSCSTRYNNGLRPKIETQPKIKTVSQPKSKCLHKTIKEMSIKSGRGYTYNKIRSIARNLTRLEPKICSKCGYAKHVEVCHIKAIRDFSEDTLISVVNSRDNLVILCRNCHWELDNEL